MRLTEALGVVWKAGVSIFIRAARVLISKGNIVFIGPLENELFATCALFTSEEAVISKFLRTYAIRSL